MATGRRTNGSAKNPYGHGRVEDVTDKYDGTAPQTGAYTATKDRAPYGLPNTPYAEPLDVSALGTPEDDRVGLREGNSFRVDPSRPRSLWSGLFQDRRIRESIGRFFGTMPERKDPQVGAGATRWVRRAGEIPPAETRVTQQMSPHNFGYVRGDSMTGGTPRRFTGVHASLANFDRIGDHTQYGMVPPRQARSTVLRALVPWGENIVDNSQQNADYTNDEIDGIQDYVMSTPARGRSARLGA